jgi:hypothetical protein
VLGGRSTGELERNAVAGASFSSISVMPGILSKGFVSGLLRELREKKKKNQKEFLRDL